jgi:predicted CoA-binding protein
MFANPPDEVIRDILATPCHIAVVGCSPHPFRDSHRIARLLIERGHEVTPVNPNVSTVLGRRCFAALADVPTPIDMVDIFRRSAEAGRVVDEAIAVGANVIWMQLGVVDVDAALRAQAAGLIVVMDRCPAIEYERLAIA